jgi:hypothetical protein
MHRKTFATNAWLLPNPTPSRLTSALAKIRPATHECVRSNRLG